VRAACCQACHAASPAPRRHSHLAPAQPPQPHQQPPTAFLLPRPCRQPAPETSHSSRNAGAEYPDKLESYQHRTAPPGGATLAHDVRGCWALHWDAFRGVAVLRSLLAPGYCFYYSASELSWGGFYQGDGLRNHDLIFML
jgi:hypothetical protein